jgi:hypothetical protein
MNKISIFKKPAIIKLWLGRAVPVYVFLVLSFIIIKFGLTAYLKHKYPPLIKEDTIFGVRVPFAKRVYKDRWLVTYDKWSPYFYVTVIGIAGIWMFVLLGSTSEVARDLSMSALEKSDKEEAADDLSRAIYNLKIAASFSLDENLIDDINKKIEQLKSSLSSKSAVLNKTFTGQKQADSGKTVVKQTSDNADSIANRYKKIKKLGQGAMGIVWLSEDTVLERQVAIKELPVHIAEDAEFKERFFREAKLLARLTHPNIVQLYDIIEDRDAIYYTMEYVEGASLDQVVKASRLPIDTILDYAMQILKGMDYAHSMKIIHRDLKPMNIMVRKDNIIKIADFGLAKLVGSSSVTIAGTVMGSPMYMSPEQAAGEDADERSDIYSFSMILYELITGTPAFTGMPRDVIAKQIQATPAMPSTLVSIPNWLDELIIKGLSKNREQRYQKISDMMTVIAGHKNQL